MGGVEVVRYLNKGSTAIQQQRLGRNAVCTRHGRLGKAFRLALQLAVKLAPSQWYSLGTGMATKRTS